MRNIRRAEPLIPDFSAAPSGARLLAEFDHRYNHRVALGYSDIDRTLAAIRGIEGKRLMYRQPH